MQIVLSLFAYYKLRQNFLRYICVITTVYFISYFTAGSFDIALTLYFGFICLGVGFPEKLPLGLGLYGSFLLVYTLIGLVFQNAFSTVTSLITRYSYLIAFILILCGKKSLFAKKPDRSDFRFLVWLGLFTEILIVALVWMRHGIGARVVSNNQPIGAGIAIALATLIPWCYHARYFTAGESLIYNLICVIITVLSGTRGYMVIIALPMAVWAIMYILDEPGRGKQMAFRFGMAALALAVVLIWLIIIDRGETLISILRLDQGLGYRENENKFVREILARAPWYEMLFGFGFGGTASHVRGFETVLHIASWNREFMYSKLSVQTIFHNYWYTVLFKQGMAGLLTIVWFYLSTLLRVGRLKTDMWIRWLLWMAIAGNLASLTFRISASCSIFEMVIIAYLIRLMEEYPTEKEKTAMIISRRK